MYGQKVNKRADAMVSLQMHSIYAAATTWKKHKFKFDRERASIGEAKAGNERATPQPGCRNSNLSIHCLGLQQADATELHR